MTLSQHFALNLSSVPASEPLTIVEARLHLRLTATGSPATHPDDALVTDLIKAARQKVEKDTDRGLITQTWVQHHDFWPDSGIILLRKAPVQDVTSVTYVDIDGTTQTVTTSDYRKDLVSVPARIEPAFSASWPSARNVSNSISTTFVVGYDGGSPAGTVDEDLMVALKLLLGHYYENREEIVLGATVTDLKKAYDRLIDNFIVTV